jgi:hypothetical protein
MMIFYFYSEENHTQLRVNYAFKVARYYSSPTLELFALSYYEIGENLIQIVQG